MTDSFLCVGVFEKITSRFTLVIINVLPIILITSYIFKEQWVEQNHMD